MTSITIPGTQATLEIADVSDLVPDAAASTPLDTTSPTPVEESSVEQEAAAPDNLGKPQLTGE